MFMNYFVLNFLSFWTLSYQSNKFLPNDKNFDDHLIDLMDHLRLQNGWKSLSHINLMMNDNVINVSHVIDSDVNEANVRPRFQQMTLFFNYRYAELLLKIQEIVDFIISHCQERFPYKDFFKECLVHLRGTITDSVTIYKRLYDYMRFMKQIYSSITMYISGSEPEIIDTILLAFINFVEKISNSTPIEKSTNAAHKTEFHSVVNFYRIDMKKQLGNFFTRNSSFYRISTDAADVLASYDIQPPKNYPGYNACKIREIIKDFYNRIIKKLCDDFGFDKILHVQHLGLPQSGDFDQPKKDISSLNTILKQSGWHLLDHISLKSEYDDELDVDKIISGDLNSSNFFMKAYNLHKLLRCRYAEILNHYDLSINKIIIRCRYEIKSIKEMDYVDCVVQLYDSVSKSRYMFDYMLYALTSMGSISNFQYQYAYQLRLKNIILAYRDFIEKMDSKYFSVDIFIDKQGNGSQQTANYYLTDIVQFRNDKIVPNIRKMFEKEMKYCLFNTYLDTNKFKKEYTEIPVSKNTDSMVPADFTLIMCNNLNLYCEKVIAEDYKNLGFDQI